MEDFVKLSSKVGLHGRPGALLVDLAGKNPQATIILEKSGKKAEANSILNLLALGVGKGEQVRVRVEGKDAEKIFQEVKAILQGMKA